MLGAYPVLAADVLMAFTASDSFNLPMMCFLVNRPLLIPDLLFGVFYQEIFRGICGPVVRERVTPPTSTPEFYQITFPVSIVSFVVCGNGARGGAFTIRLSLRGLPVSCSGPEIVWKDHPSSALAKAGTINTDSW